MSTTDIVQCLSELSDANLTLKKAKTSQKACLIAQRLAEITNSLTKCDRFHYGGEAILGLVNGVERYHYDNDNDSVNCDSDSNCLDDEWNNEDDAKQTLG